MSDSGGEYGDAVLADIEASVRQAAPRWNLPADCAVTLLNVSENATWRLDDTRSGRRIVLRVHRIGYHTTAEIHSELAWIEALRTEGVVETPEPLAARDGGLVQTLVSPTGRPARQAVAFAVASGREPEQNEALVPWFERLGSITARMHGHARRWTRPPGFARKLWDFDAMLGSRPLWGAWQAGLGLDAASRAQLGRIVDGLREAVQRYGTEPARFGLVHADLRLANLLVDGDRLSVIDFDDCGLSWYVYDFAAAVSFFEHDPIVSDLADAWVEGYRSVSPLPEDDVAAIPTFVMLRRALLTAWLASHAEIPLAKELGAGYTAGTLDLGEAWLTRHAR